MITRSNANMMAVSALLVSLLLWTTLVATVHADSSCDNPFANRELTLLNGSSISYLREPSSDSANLIAACPSLRGSSCCSPTTEGELYRITETFHSGVVETLRYLPAVVISRALERIDTNVTFDTLTAEQMSILRSVQKIFAEVVSSGATATCIDMLTSHVAGALCWSCSPEWHHDVDNATLLVDGATFWFLQLGCTAPLDAAAAQIPALTELAIRFLNTLTPTPNIDQLTQWAFVLYTFMAQTEMITFESLVRSSLVDWLTGLDAATAEMAAVWIPLLRGLDYDFAGWLRPYVHSQWAPFRVDSRMSHQSGDIWHRLQPNGDGHGHRRLLSVEVAQTTPTAQHEMALMHGGGGMEHSSEAMTPPPVDNSSPSQTLVGIVRHKDPNPLLLSPNAPTSNDPHYNGRLFSRVVSDDYVHLIRIGCQSPLTHNSCPSETLNILLPQKTFVPVLITALSLIALIALVLTVRHNMAPSAKTFRRMKRDGDKFITADTAVPVPSANTDANE